MDPIRGFNRLLSGNAKGPRANPEDPLDWRPKGAPTFLATGVRVIGQGESITENTETYGTILLNHAYGNVFENTRHKPFDYMELVAELDLGEKVRLDKVQIRGNLARASGPRSSRASGCRTGCVSRPGWTRTA